MKFSVIMPNYNGDRFLEQAVHSIIRQKADVDVELIIVDGGSTDDSHQILQRYSEEIDHLIVGEDSSPPNAINIGFQRATGDILAWLNSDDFYRDHALLRVQETIDRRSDDIAMCFGRCTIVNEDGQEVRRIITRFKELLFPFSSRFTYQCVNYISQPSLFVLSSAAREAGPLREDLVAAWDYEWILRLWSIANATSLVDGSALSCFRVHSKSISAQCFRTQFREELHCAIKDAGIASVPAVLHIALRPVIVTVYALMWAYRSFVRGT